MVPAVAFIVTGIMAYGQMRQEVIDLHERIARLEDRFYDHLQGRCDAPEDSENRTKLTAIVATAIPLTVAVWGVATAFGKTIAANDVALVILAIGGPLGYLAGKTETE